MGNPPALGRRCECECAFGGTHPVPVATTKNFPGTPLARSITVASGYVFFEVMSLITVLSRDPDVRTAVERLPRLASVSTARRWERLANLALERPVTDVIFDGGAFEAGDDVGRLISDFHHRFPSIGLTFVAPGRLDPGDFLAVGRLMDGRGLYLGTFADVSTDVRRGLAASARRSVSGRLLQAVGHRLGAFERTVLRAAMGAVVLGWDADRFAAHVGYSRPHLSVRLRRAHLPSAGRLLSWARLLHAGQWLTDPGRTGQSVARQLDYANGSTFRRALRNFVGLTPTQVVLGGGFRIVCEAFMDLCGLGGDLPGRAGGRRPVA